MASQVQDKLFKEIPENTLEGIWCLTFLHLLTGWLSVLLLLNFPLQILHSNYIVLWVGLAIGVRLRVEVGVGVGVGVEVGVKVRVGVGVKVGVGAPVEIF